MNVARWNELREMEKNNPSELMAIAKKLGLDKTLAKSHISAMDVMIAENKVTSPDTIKNINDWIK